MSRLTALAGGAQREAVNNFRAVPGIFDGTTFHHGHRRSFFGKIKPMEISGCKPKGLGCENTMVLQSI
jgi:hypothetical protein